MDDASARPVPTCRGIGAATATVYPDGPLVLRGEFSVVDADGERFDAGHMVALCRCGRSAVKPWCDGSHRRGPLQRGSAD